LRKKLSVASLDFSTANLLIKLNIIIFNSNKLVGLSLYVLD
jgi:hypothetical protein